MAPPERYRLILVKEVVRIYRRLPRDLRRRMRDALRKIAHDPRLMGSERLKGQGFYRHRVGDWRIVYNIQDDVRVVLVLKIGSRGQVYRER